MNAKSSSRPYWPAVLAFGVAQIIGWGVTFNLPGVIGTSIAESFETSLDAVLLGPTIMLTILAFVSWWIAPLFERYGARLLMIGGAFLLIAGLLVMSVAPNIGVYFVAWAIFGIGGAASLSTAAQIALAEVAGDRARQAIGAMSLVSGLSNTVLWPIVSRIDQSFGWRTVVIAGSVAMLLIYIPLVAKFGNRQSQIASKSAEKTESGNQSLDARRFALVAGVTALNGFITWGFSLTLIPLLTQKGLNINQAVTLASALGIISIAARSADVLGNWSPLRSAIVSTGTMFSAFLLLFLGSSVTVAITFVLLYGLAGGLMAVVRATLPLAIFPAAAYARASAKLALPMNLAFAAAPPVFARILESNGANSALLLSIVLSGGAMLCLVALLHQVHRS